ncbi:MAG: hypothetical protein IPK20_10160 [Betaproteobacteria bacterium]|nr:hypothetical protein [Betaproteobacteria bacterium]
MMSFRLHLLGGFELTGLDGDPCALPPKKCRALLAWICLSRARSASRAAMASMLWPEASEEQARTSLRQCLAALRRVAPLLEADTESIALSSALTDVDVWQFEQGAGHDDLRVAEPALQRYGGELLAGLQLDAPEFEQWRRVEAERLRRLATQSGTRIVDVLARSGDAGRAVENALRVLAIDPLQEDLHRRVMQLYVALGRPADAIRQYRRCRELLGTELGTRPEPETESLYRKLVDPERRQTLIPGTPPTALDAPARTETGRTEADAAASDAREAFVAIADVSGFAAYSATHDVDLVHEFLTRYRSAVRNIVQARGGMLANFIGARVMIVFGAPVARGNDAARIVDASLSILAAVENLQGMAGSALKARAGVATGRVIAALEEGQWIISGAPVSAAGRIVEAAPAGEVWIADRIAQALGERLAADPVEGAVVSALGSDQRLWRAPAWGGST